MVTRDDGHGKVDRPPRAPAHGMELIVVGLSHRTAPLPVRERLAVSGDRLPDELRSVERPAPTDEGLLISTCNRVELYTATSDARAAVAAARLYFASRGEADVDDYLYAFRGGDAVRHAFRVTASLDSMVVGEPQILGQVKQAYAAAETAGTLGTLLGRCFDRAFAAAKRVRSETGIAAGAVSVSSIAVDLAKKIFSRLDGRHVLLLGAGEMGEAAAKSLANQGSHLVVVNRSPKKAEALAAEYGGRARPYDQLTAELVRADVVITSTSSPRFVITRDVLDPVVRARKGRPLFLVDIAVPRDVDPRVSNVENVFLYDVDDLQKVAGANLAARRREAEAAEGIVGEEVAQFERWRRSLSLAPTIAGLRGRFHAVVRSELERTLPRLPELDGKQHKALEAMTDAIVKKLLHHPVMELKQRADEPEGARLVDAAQLLFGLAPVAEAPSDPATRGDPERNRRGHRGDAPAATTNGHAGADAEGDGAGGAPDAPMDGLRDVRRGPAAGILRPSPAVGDERRRGPGDPR